MLCRWCSSRLSTYSDGTPYCQAGCAGNDNPSYLKDCQECGREFETGAKAATFCWECDTRLRNAQIAESMHAPKGTGYNANMRKQAANREAMKILRE